MAVVSVLFADDNDCCGIDKEDIGHYQSGICCLFHCFFSFCFFICQTSWASWVPNGNSSWMLVHCVRHVFPRSHPYGKTSIEFHRQRPIKQPPQRYNSIYVSLSLSLCRSEILLSTSTFYSIKILNISLFSNQSSERAAGSLH